MDSLHAIGFYASSGVSLIGGMGVALLPGREMRGMALAIVGLGLAGIDVSLSAGAAAAVALVCFSGCGALVAGPRYRSVEGLVSPLWRQVGGAAAAALVAVLAFSAYRADFVHAKFFGGAIDAAALGRVLFAHDALATVAVAMLVAVSLIGAAATWRARERAR